MKYIAVIAVAALGVPSLAQEYRSIDGTGNNLADPALGSAGTVQIRGAEGARYADGLSAMMGGPNARVVSNTLGTQTASGNARGLSAMFWQWGQFIDHDITLVGGGHEFSPIFAPGGDPVFQAGEMIPFVRSAFTTDGSGTRAQVNQITHFLDGSMIYGSDETRAAALRSFSGGMLLTGADGMMPRNTAGLDNANEGFLPGESLFLAGDVRANEQAGLTALHQVFVDHHNQWAERLAVDNPGWDDEQIYQTARKIVGAQVQKITYEDWLPAMGVQGLSSYAGYDESVDPSISTLFSTAAFRFGHTMLNEELLRMNADGTAYSDGPLTLRNNFFNPGTLEGEGALDALIRGMTVQAAEEMDLQMVDGVRSFLFGPPGAGGLDLLALNLQRGRDHGLPTYAEIRDAFGLDPVTGWSDITSDAALQEALASVYTDVGEVEAWIGLMAEDHLADASMGETLEAIMRDQFGRLRDGDRFFYLNDPDLDPYMLEIEGTTLADIFRSAAGVDGLGDNVFFATAVPAPGGVALLGVTGLLAGRRRRRAGC